MHVLMSHSLENLLGGVQPVCSHWLSSSSLALCGAFLLGPSASAHHCLLALHPSGLCICGLACWSPPIAPPRPSEMAPFQETSPTALGGLLCLHQAPPLSHST